MQTNSVPVLNVANTRANLQRLGVFSEPKARRGYLDRDVPQEPKPVAPPSPSSPFPASHHGKKAFAPFEDLDATPLQIGNTPSDPSPTASPVVSNQPPVQPPASSDVTHGQTGLAPAEMRRIILHATTAKGAAPAYGRTQANIGERGLCFGIGRFCQSDGGLGHYLKACLDADATAFAQHFGPGDDLPNANAAALLSTATAETEAARMAAVGGELLWSPAWIKRFKGAAMHTPFQDMQFKAAADLSLLPMVATAMAHNMDTERGLALLVDRAILMGVTTAIELAEATLSPQASSSQNIAALAGAAAATPLAGRATDLVAEVGLSDTPLALSEAAQ